MANEKRLIDANALLKWLEECTDEKDWLVSQYNADWIWSMLDSATTVDAVEVVHGRWVGSGQWNHKPYRMRNKEKWQTYLCSECGRSNGRRFNDNYCPNCGAKMDGERKEAE